jgi:hypothetical protein
MKKFLGVLVCVLVLMVPISAMALSVDLELALVIDVSGSVDQTEFELQRDGYVKAFNSSAIRQAIWNGAYGKIAVSAIFFDSTASVALDWMLIKDDASADAFTNAFANLTDLTSGNTNIAAGINLATERFNVANGYEGTRNVIDVSGDGVQNYPNYGPGDLETARDNALASGVDAINGLAILTDVSDLDDYYSDHLQVGTGSFTMAVADFTDFGDAIDDKLIREIQPVIPEPSTLLLLGAGLIGVFALGRKKLAKK